MRFQQKKLFILLTLICLVSQTAYKCGGDVVSPRSVIAGAPTLINFLVSKGKLKPETGERLKTDFNDGAECALTLEDTLDQIPKNDPNARSRKREAWLAAADCWKPIVLRQNVFADPQVQNIATLITDLFAAGVRFYTDRQKSEGATAASTQAVPDEKAFDKDVQRRLKELKEAMKTP